MKLEDIKKMSNEEFIEFVNSIRDEKDKSDLDIKEILNDSLRYSLYGLGGVGIGAFSTFISSKFTDESLILGIVAIFGTIVGIPLSRKFIKYYIWPDALNEEKQKLIQLKRDIESLTDEELLILKSVNNNLYQLQDEIKDIFCAEPNIFLNYLEPSYKDDEENLGYSKNINKNN